MTHTHAIISVDYEPYDPSSYRAIHVVGDDVKFSEESGDFCTDLSQAVNKANRQNVLLFFSSSFDNYLFDLSAGAKNGAVEPLYATRARLCVLHDAWGLSWRDLAAREEYSGVSHATLRDIANGSDPSPETCRALGFSKTPYRTLAFRFYDEADFNRARAAVGKERTKWLMERIGDDNG